MLHIFAGRVQHVVDHKIGFERKHVFPQFAPLDDGLVIACGDVGGGEFAFFGADEKDLMVGDLVGQHERTEDVPHADGGIARDHEHHAALLQKAFAQPPVSASLLTMMRALLSTTSSDSSSDMKDSSRP